MRATRAGGVDAPDCTPVPLATVFGMFHHRLLTVGVALSLGEHEKILVSAGRPVFHAFWHGVWLVPDDVATEKPTALLKREGESPWNAEKILVFQTRRVVRPHVHGTIWILLVRRSPSSIPARIAVSDIQPEDSIRLQHALYLGKNGGQRLDETRQCRFQADLAPDPVITQPPIRRGGNDTLHRLGWKTCER